MPAKTNTTKTAPQRRDCTLVLLTLNEIDGLRLLWDQIPVDEFQATVAVDGGSTDGTREFLTERGIHILDQPTRGRGVAFRVAASWATTERMVYYSPDGNEDPDDIVRLDDLVAGGADLAIARRFGPGAVNEEDGLVRPRARVNQALTWVANRIFNRGEYVHDTINGFRAFRREPFLVMGTTVERFPIEYQTSIRAMKRGWRIAELPTHEGQRAGGESKALSLPVGKDHIAVLLSELPGPRWLR